MLNSKLVAVQIGNCFLRFEYGLGYILTKDKRLATRFASHKEARQVGKEISKRKGFKLVNPHDEL